MSKRASIGGLGARLAKAGEGATGRRRKVTTHGETKNLNYAVPVETWEALKLIAVAERKTLRGVILDAYDAHIANYKKRAK